MTRAVRWSIVGAVLGALLVAAYVYGRRTERDEAKAKERQAALKHNAEQLRLSDAVLEAQHRTSLAEAAKDSILRARRRGVRGKIRVLSDSVFQVVAVDSAGAVVDSGGPKYQIPEVVSLVRIDDATIAQSDTAFRAKAAENRTLYRRDTLHVAREALQDEAIQEAKPQRCGRRCGFVAGVTVALAVTHPGETIRIGKQVIGLAARLIGR